MLETPMIAPFTLQIWFRSLRQLLQMMAHRAIVKTCMENVLNLLVHATAPYQKYIRGCVLGWSWNVESDATMRCCRRFLLWILSHILLPNYLEDGVICCALCTLTAVSLTHSCFISLVFFSYSILTCVESVTFDKWFDLIWEWSST